MFLCHFSAVFDLFFSWCRLCIPLPCNAAWEIYIFRYEIVTQTEMSCCPVAVKLGVESFILAVHFKSFRVGVYCVISFSLSVFFVTFLHTYFRYFWKHNVLVLMICNEWNDPWRMMPTLYIQTTLRLKDLKAMKKKSEKFNTCTVCLSKMYKLLGVWAVAWLLLDQVCSVYI